MADAMHECEISKLVETSRIRDVAQVFVLMHVVLLMFAMLQ